jgi:hypothetical protein
VTLLESGRAAQADGDGRFVLRGVPAGTVTLVARSRQKEVRKRVVVPAAPGSVKGVELAIP